MAARQHAIFIGYRRDDSADTAGRIYDRLEQRFGREHVFKDVDSIPYGEDFRTYVGGVIQQCRVLLVLIGLGWLGAKHIDGRRRLDDADDLVRIEIETALGTPGVKVVPVLVGGAAMPAPDQLPASLKKLCRLNAAQVRRDPDFRHDMDRLIHDMALVFASSVRAQSQTDEVPGQATKAPTRKIQLALAAGALLLAVTGAALYFRGTKQEPAAVAVVRTSVAAASAKPMAREPDMVTIPGGRFLMGSPASELGRTSDEDQRWVDVAQFMAGKYEVTSDEWDACVADGVCQDRKLKGANDWGGGTRPAVRISWDDTQEYFSWLNRKFPGKNYRLLTDAEWEYAARAGASSAYPWGPKLGSGNANCAACGSAWDGQMPAPVGSFPANKFGLQDIIDNASEWVQDCHVDGDYGCSLRGIRGGSFLSQSEITRSAARSSSAPEATDYDFGFRIARSY